MLDGSELPPGETERERALVPGLRVVASYDLGKEGGARAVTAWTQEPSPRWISPNADHVIGTVKGALAVCVIPSKPPRGVKEHGNLKRVAGVAAKRFRGLLQPQVKRIYAVSADGERAVVTKGPQGNLVFGELSVKTGDFAPLDVDSQNHTRVRYVGSTLWYSPASGDPLVWDGRKKRWAAGPGGRLAGSSLDGTWLLMKSSAGYRLVKVKWH